MTTKTKQIIEWILVGLVAFIFLGSAFGKFTAPPKSMEVIGVSDNAMMILAIIEVVAVALFAFKRTSILGTFLLVAYMGGAIATHLEHKESILAPCGIAAFVWIVAFFRIPELSQRLKGN